MARKTSKPASGKRSKQLSPETLKAVRAFKRLTVSRTPSGLKGRKASAIRKAVRGYYLG